MEKDVVVALVGAGGGLLAVVISGILGRREARGRRDRKNDAIDLAQREVAFLSAWYNLRKDTGPAGVVTQVRRSLAEDLDRLRRQVDELVHEPKKSQDQEPSRPPLQSRPHSWIHGGAWARAGVSTRSDIALRTTIGVLGLALPLVLTLVSVVTDGTVRTIAEAYSTDMRAIPMAGLVGIAVCLFFYKGYMWIDRVASALQAVAALCYGLIPPEAAIPATLAFRTVSFAVLIGVAALSSSFLFTLNIGRKPTRTKLQRNMVYRVCGWTMLACIAIVWLSPLFPRLKLVYYLEVAAFLSFGLSWLTKAKLVFPASE